MVSANFVFLCCFQIYIQSEFFNWAIFFLQAARQPKSIAKHKQFWLSSRLEKQIAYFKKNQAVLLSRSLNLSCKFSICLQFHQKKKRYFSEILKKFGSKTKVLKVCSLHIFQNSSKIFEIEPTNFNQSTNFNQLILALFTDNLSVLAFG